MEQGLPVVVSINLEPDDRVTKPDGTSLWDGVEPTMALVEQWRTERPDARVGWYWRCDPSIQVGFGDPGWALRRWSAQIDQSIERGDEVGTHPHYWRWSDALGTFVSEAADPEWITHCIRLSVETMRSHTASPARVVMIGDGYVDRISARTFDDLGVEIDLTLEPDGAARSQMVHTEYTTGTMPDRHNAPRRPFRPSRRNPLRRSRVRRARHWALPLTSATEPTVRDRVTIDRVGTPANLGLDPWRFRTIVASGLAASVRAGAPYVHVVVRSDIGVNRGLKQHTADNLRWLADGMDDNARRWGGVRFVTPHEAMRCLGHQV